MLYTYFNFFLCSLNENFGFFPDTDPKSPEKSDPDPKINFFDPSH